MADFGTGGHAFESTPTSAFISGSLFQMMNGRVSLPCPFSVLHRIEPDIWHAEGRGFESRRVHGSVSMVLGIDDTSRQGRTSPLAAGRMAATTMSMSQGTDGSHQFLCSSARNTSSGLLPSENDPYRPYTQDLHQILVLLEVSRAASQNSRLRGSCIDWECILA